MTMLVLTMIGADRPGLVDRLSQVINDHGGNWEQSHMGHLAGRFAGIVTVRVADERSAPLIRALQALASQGLQVQVESGDSTPRPPTRALCLELLGHDRAGIVHDIAHALAEHGVSIDSLETDTRSASMSAETMFHARVELSAPLDLDLDALTETLENIANELMVDLDFDPGPAEG